MFNLTIISLVVGLLALIIASWSDIKTREVPDWLSYSLVAFAVGSALILSLYHGYSHIIINSLIGLGIGVAIGLFMFYTGQWGGGDSKLIMGLSALIGFSFSDFQTNLPNLLIFVLNILLVGAAYGLIFSFVKALLNFKAFRQAALKKLRSKEMIVIRVILLVIIISAFVFLLVSRSVESAMVFGLAMVLFIFFYLWTFVSIIEKTCMISDIKVKDLTEGDWVINNVVKRKGKQEKLILKPTKTGITEKQIARLKKHHIRKVTVKVGVPFVPSFLVAYILTFAFGNWLIYFL